MVLKIAHRGFSSLAPENSIEAFKKAAESGVDMVEFDVHGTKDGHIIVIHDENLKRTTDGQGFIKDLTLEEIKKFHEPNGEQIPTLEEVMEILKDKCALNIEIKDRNLTDNLLTIIKKEKITNIVLSSFQLNVIKKIEKKEPTMKTAWLLAETKFKISLLYVFRSILPYFIKMIAKHVKMDSVGLYYKLITKKLVQILHKENIKIVAWTINKEEDFEKMQSFGVDAIISDKPEILNI